MTQKTFVLSIFLMIGLFTSLALNGWMVLHSPKTKISPVPPLSTQSKEEKSKVTCAPNPLISPQACFCPKQEAETKTNSPTSTEQEEVEEMRKKMFACYRKESLTALEKPESAMTAQERSHYFRNLCLTEDPEACRKLFGLADEQCKQGNQASCIDLAWILVKGNAGISADPKEAVTLLEENCSSKSSSTCTTLGTILERGANDLPKDLKRAMAAYQINCNQNGASCDDVGRLLEKEGKENPASLTQALQQYQKACDAQSSQGCYHAFMLSKQGIGTDQTREALEQKIKMLCDKGEHHACRAVAAQIAGFPANQTEEEERGPF